MNKSENINELATALAKFQEEIKDPSRDATNPFFKSKYVTLDLLLKSIRPILTKHGLSIFQEPKQKDDKVGCSTLLLHSSGQYIEADAFYMASAKKDAQGFGSTLTYARRYTLSAVLGVAWDDDDDGNSASGNDMKKLFEQFKKECKKYNLTKDEIGILMHEFGVNRFSELSNADAKKMIKNIATNRGVKTKEDLPIENTNEWAIQKGY